MIKAIVILISALIASNVIAKPRNTYTTTEYFKGYPILCIQSGNTLSCDWITYHKESDSRLETKLLCEKLSLKRREAYTKDGVKTFFPKVKGECE